MNKSLATAGLFFLHCLFVIKYRSSTNPISIATHPLIRHLTFFNTRLQFNPSTLVSFDGLITLKKKRNFTLQKIIVLEKRGSHEPFMSF